MNCKNYKDKLRENLNNKDWDKLPFDEEEFKDLPTHCYKCKKPIDIFEGYYVVADWQYACSEKCTRQMLSKEEYQEGVKEWEEEGDSNIFYWTDWS
tara:strand:+ start:676 stop:963 length:288 start_codon:yes stop_codon:yes gene_type:complete